MSSAVRKLGCVVSIWILFVPLNNAAQAPATSSRTGGPAENFYLQLSNVGLDPKRVFRIRESSIDRPGVHITLEDGTIGFTRDVLGKITGAFFEGDGEVLVTPPNAVERRSLSLFTGMAILEERFSTAYFRFNDDTANELQPSLRQAEDAQAFADRWNGLAQHLAEGDAMRLLASFSEMLPGHGQARPDQSKGMNGKNADDRMLHARLQSNTLGAFDIFFDSSAAEQVEVGQAKATQDGGVFYNVWTSFSIGDRVKGKAVPARALETLPEATTREDTIFVRNYVINAQVKPPKEIDAEARLDLEVRHDGSRFLVFELSRFLEIQSVEEDGQPVEFVHNPSAEGTRLARSANDLVAVILNEPLRKGQKIVLRFVYRGEVLAEAGKGLLYVGARGTWYPNRGLSMSNFDLTFHSPPGWTLVATGKPSPLAQDRGETPNSNEADAGGGMVTTRWISERPLPVAGFDLGKYVRATARAGNVEVETYATASLEKDFPRPAPEVEPAPKTAPGKILPEVTAPFALSPARNASDVAESAAAALRFYAVRFGPYPYRKLALTQLPGRESQGWPGLIFLSSYAFLTREERQELHVSAANDLIDQQVPAHEAAHQWWGDLVAWKTYHDQWFSEGLANYCALLILREKDPEGFRSILEQYRQDLVKKNSADKLIKDAGPVTLGSRLFSSEFPNAYESIAYGRGTWLFYMLHSMLKDASLEDAKKNTGHGIGEDRFLLGLRKIRQRYEGKSITTRELFDVFAEDLPPALRYEGKRSLDWFLSSWVNGTSLPKLELQGVKISAKANGLEVSGIIRQRNMDENLVTSVPIYAVVSGRAPILLGRFFADGAETTFHASAPAGTHKLLLDPEETVLTAPK